MLWKTTDALWKWDKGERQCLELQLWPLFVYLRGCGCGSVRKCLKLYQSETEHRCIPPLPEDTSIIFFWKSIAWSKSDVESFPLSMQKGCKHMFLLTTKILLKRRKGKERAILKSLSGSIILKIKQESVPRAREVSLKTRASFGTLLGNSLSNSDLIVNLPNQPI